MYEGAYAQIGTLARKQINTDSQTNAQIDTQTYLRMERKTGVNPQAHREGDTLNRYRQVEIDF